MNTLITCHANADCDAFAAMLAAQRLYPESLLLFPGTQEAGLASVYDNLDKAKYNFITPQSINWDEIKCLVIVDTCQASRVKHVSRLLERPDVRIVIWDHHPPSSDDIATSHLHICDTGSVTSCLCAELMARSICLDPDEASLLGLGIYADTGSFTYSSTTQADFAAASWLLGQGMDVNRINDMANHELTSMHVHALNSLLESARTYMINDIPVVLAEASMDHYLGDFAYLAHKLMEMEKFKVLFALGIMGDRIQIVARSRCDEINVGEICAELGGGGHVYAASASVRFKMITEVRETILRMLSEQAAPVRKASDYMSSPAVGVHANASIGEADELMLHFGLKAVPVFKNGTHACAGLLDAQTAARANAHGLGSEKVEEYMQRRVSTLPPDASINDLASIIVGERQRLVPIVENGEITGVVTRTDLINVFASEAANISFFRKKETRQRNVQKLMRERLSSESQRILALAGNIGSRLGLPVYAVGGFVRDLLLNHANHDIDLVAEGNGIALARELAAALGGRVREHDKFLTSVVIYHDDQGVERHIDVATARLEYYEYPAALPTVELSSIKMDLFRRDFSINALAVRLDGDPPGELVDFFGGQRDIKDKIIRVLHTLSFVEDPTRCIRAVRFEQRYKFRIGPGTEKLIKNILPMHLLEKLSPHRLFNEFRLLCNEENASGCLVRLNELGILNAISTHLVLNPVRMELLGALKNIMSWYRLLFFEEGVNGWICYFLALCHNLNYAEASECYRRLGLPEARKGEIMRQREQLRILRPKLLKWQKNMDQGTARISELYIMLSGCSIEALLYGMAAFANPGLEKNISLYITTWRREKADINGDDLRRLGIEPGPIMGELLRVALLAKLDGIAPTAKKQLAHALGHVKKKGVQSNTDLP